MSMYVISGTEVRPQYLTYGSKINLPVFLLQDYLNRTFGIETCTVHALNKTRQTWKIENSCAFSVKRYLCRDTIKASSVTGSTACAINRD